MTEAPTTLCCEARIRGNALPLDHPPQVAHGIQTIEEVDVERNERRERLIEADRADQKQAIHI